MEGELIYVAIIMQLGTIITIYVWSNTSLSKYFKKENFKTGLDNVRATNKLQLKKLERELGLKSSGKSPTIEQNVSPLDKLSQLSQLAPLIKNLDSEQLGTLIDKFIGGGEILSGDEQEGGLGGLLDAIPKPLIDNFLKGLKEGGESGPQDQEQEIESQV